jgi:ferredoxin/protein involved in ribonucleotide reduction
MEAFVKMKINHVWAVYFSPTGTTKKVVSRLSQSIAQGLGASWQEYSFNLPEARQKDLSFGPSDLVILGVPVYAGRVPNQMLPFIRDQIHGSGTLAVPVVLFGNRNFDDGLMELRNVLAINGFHPITAGAFVGQHSFSEVLGAGRPDHQDMDLVEELAEQTIKKVLELKEPPNTPVSVEGQDPIRPYYIPKDSQGVPLKDFLKAKPVTDLGKCINCGLCAIKCPMGSIDSEDVSRVVGKCIKCCACIKGCPSGAKYFDSESFLFHLHDLEERYAGIRAESRIFL